MLRLINVCKSFKYGKNKILVLDNINIDFKKNELVFILGKSGSGKSTLLNIIGGLLEVDSGKILLDDKDITKFNKKMLCSYRNNMIGFVFQNYNLIEYMSVLDNIRLGMTVKNNNGINLNDILKKLGMYKKRWMKVNRLSGGEKQRVAIARAIINDPDIILCDEPTGALDSNNGIKIMNILKEISRDKLVIVVSHDNNLANKYADRVIKIDDGKTIYYPQIDNGGFKEIKNKKIRLGSIIKLSIKNLGLKKGRTFFTSLAISIGVLCILLVLCLSKSFNEDIDKLEREIVSSFPISIYNGEFESVNNEIDKSNDKIIIKDKDLYIHENKISLEYIDYVKKIDEINYISYYYDISMPLVSDRYKILDNSYMKMSPGTLFIDDNYDILYGRNITSMNEIILKIDINNNVNSELLNIFNINNDIDYSEIVGRKIRVIHNDIYYFKNREYYFINNDIEWLYKNSDIELEIVGIVREKEETNNNSYFYYSNELIEHIIKINSKSKIVLDQINRDYPLLGIDIDKDKLLSYLGYNCVPSGIDIYVSNVDDKGVVISKLDEYNKINDKDILYVDTMMDAINIVKDMIDIITVILLIFSGISVLVSSLMIFILTNNRVIERVKEIGIIKSLGARDRDITRLFNIENFIIGIISSLMGIVVMLGLKRGINYLFFIVLNDNDMFNIYSDVVIITFIINIIIVVLSGYIPSLIASKKGIIDCLNNRI